MWFSETKNEKKLRELISKVRPVLLANYEAFDEMRVIDKTQLSMMHYCFSIGLNEINEQMKLPAKPYGFRILESDENGPIAIYQFDLDVDNSKSCGTYFDKRALNYFEESLKNLEKHAHGDTSGEIRYLRVAALNQEITWLHHAGNKEEKFVVNEYSEKRQAVYTETQLINFLNTLKLKLGKLDENKGG
jgi:hypothetical protein